MNAFEGEAPPCRQTPRRNCRKPASEQLLCMKRPVDPFSRCRRTMQIECTMNGSNRLRVARERRTFPSGMSSSDLGRSRPPLFRAYLPNCNETGSGTTCPCSL